MYVSAQLSRRAGTGPALVDALLLVVKHVGVEIVIPLFPRLVFFEERVVFVFSVSPKASMAFSAFSIIRESSNRYLSRPYPPDLFF